MENREEVVNAEDKITIVEDNNVKADNGIMDLSSEVQGNNEQNDVDVPVETDDSVADVVKNDKPLSEMSEEEIHDAMNQFLPDDLKDLSPEQIEEMLRQGMAPAEVNPEEKNINCFGEMYLDVKNTVSDVLYGISEIANSDNIRKLNLESVAEICNLIIKFEEDDKKHVDYLPGLELKDEDVRLDKLKKIFKIALKHFVLVMAEAGDGSLVNHNKEVLVSGFICDTYSDTLKVYATVDQRRQKLENIPNAINRYLDPIVCMPVGAPAIGAVFATIIWSQDELVEHYAKEIAGDEEVSLKHRNEAFLKIYKELF